MLIKKRFFDVQQANAEMSLTLLNWQEKNGLTDAEFLDFLTSEMRRTLKYVLRDEMNERENSED